MEIELGLAYHDIGRVIELFQEYTNRLNVDLSFQHFDDELESLPGKYALPQGRLYLATIRGESAGCIALKPLKENICEMKRLYVRPPFRKSGLGERLINTVLEDARAMHYESIYLDTLAQMESAIRLYERFGFREIPQYYHNPLDNVVFLGLDL